MTLLLCMAVMTLLWLWGKLWSWGSTLEASGEDSLALQIASRLGRTFGARRFLWRNRVATWGVQGVIVTMIFLAALPSPHLLACACSEVVVGTAVTQWNNMYVDNTDGSLNLSQSDIYVPGYSRINFVRKYWSNDNTWGPFGNGWSFTFQNYLLSSSGDISVYMQGVQQTFVAANGYSNAKGTMKLSFIGASEVKVLERITGNSWYFDLTNGWLVSSFDASGNETDYTWKTVSKQVGVDSSSNPVYSTVYCPLSVTYPDGQEMLFSYGDSASSTLGQYPGPSENYLCSQIKVTSSAYLVNYTYTNGLLTGIAKGNGQTLSYGYYTRTDSYKTQGWLTSIVYASGAEVDIGYNGNYGGDSSSPLRVTSVNGPVSYSHTYGYTASGGSGDSSGGSGGAFGGSGGSYGGSGGDLTTTKTDGLGNSTSYAYTTDGSGNVDEVDTDALSNTRSIYNNGNQLPIQIINKRGYSTYRVYDSVNSDPLAKCNLLSVTNSLGKIVSYTYDTSYDVTSVTDPLGHSTVSTYDGYRHVTSVKNGLSQLVATNTYTGYGQVASVKDGAGNVTQYQYDTAGNVTNTIDANSHNWVKTYDEDGNILTRVNPLGKTTAYTYDSFYKIASTTNALNQVTLYTRDDMANLTAVRDANGNTASIAYDQLQRPTSVTNAVGAVTQFGYNVESGTTSLTDAASHVYSYTFDALNRTKTFVYPDSSQLSYVYDQNDNLTSVTNRASKVTNRTYDAGDRLTAKTWVGTTNTTFSYSYDDANRATGVVKVTGTSTNSAIAYTYNAANQITNSVEEGRSVGYQYDNAQRLSQVSYPSGAKANYTYTAKGKLSNITDESSSAVAGFTYDTANRLTKKTLANGLESDLVYDDANRITQVTLCQTSNTNNIVQSFQYGYDNVGNKLWVKYASGSGDVYQYDASYQLTGVKYGVSNPSSGYSSAAGASRTVTYSYDAVGNRTSISDTAGSTTTYSVNNLNQYTAVAGQNYTYTSGGDLLSDGTWTYGYDREGHLISASKTGTTVNYAYDGLGRRIQKVVNGVAINYVYDRDNLIEQRDSSGTVLAKYIYSAKTDRPVKAIVGTSSYYFQHDSLGNVTALTDGSGNLAEQYTYDVYGAPVIKDGSGTTLSTSKTPFLFTGREYDSETGLYHNRARAYSPSLGRFLQTDPISFVGGDSNVYRYVANNPVNATDPTGQFLWIPVIAAIVLIAYIAAVIAGTGEDEGAGNGLPPEPEEPESEPEPGMEGMECP